VLPGVPGGVVVDPDQALVARGALARAASAAIRQALTPPGRRRAGQRVTVAMLALTLAAVSFYWATVWIDLLWFGRALLGQTQDRWRIDAIVWFFIAIGGLAARMGAAWR
jgi:hypothetical protein